MQLGSFKNIFTVSRFILVTSNIFGQNHLQLPR